VHVRSQKAGERVLHALRKLYKRLHLKVNDAKSAVTSAFGRKLLGYCFWLGPGDEDKRAVADTAIDAFKRRIRLITRRSGGRSLPVVAMDLRPYLLGWKAYFHLAQTPRIIRSLDEWLGHRLRAIQLKHWRRGTTAYRSLCSMGATRALAARVASGARRWWHNTSQGLHRVLPLAYFDRLGVPRLCCTSTSRTARCGPACRVGWELRLEAHKVQLPEMATTVKRSLQPCTESCVV